MVVRWVCRWVCMCECVGVGESKPSSSCVLLVPSLAALPLSTAAGTHDSKTVENWQILKPARWSCVERVRPLFSLGSRVLGWGDGLSGAAKQQSAAIQGPVRRRAKASFISPCKEPPGCATRPTGSRVLICSAPRQDWTAGRLGRWGADCWELLGTAGGPLGGFSTANRTLHSVHSGGHVQTGHPGAGNQQNPWWSTAATPPT
jgi:hypothetical protein